MAGRLCCEVKICCRRIGLNSLSKEEGPIRAPYVKITNLRAKERLVCAKESMASAVIRSCKHQAKESVNLICIA